MGWSNSVDEIGFGGETFLGDDVGDGTASGDVLLAGERKGRGKIQLRSSRKKKKRRREKRTCGKMFSRSRICLVFSL